MKFTKRLFFGGVAVTQDEHTDYQLPSNGYFDSLHTRTAKTTLHRGKKYRSVGAAHSQDFGEFDFIDLLSIFSSRNHSIGSAAC